MRGTSMGVQESPEGGLDNGLRGGLEAGLQRGLHPVLEGRL